MNKEEIIKISTEVFKTFTLFCSTHNDDVFFNGVADKWSPAQNLKHLIISTNTSTLAFSLPLFLLRFTGGKPNRPSKTFDELVAKYQNKLAAGGKAPTRFIPKDTTKGESKELLIDKWKQATENYIFKLQRNRTEADLDNYLISHPLLKRITLRELCYFTIYHTKHHQNRLINATTK
jgi:hypothetical protein